MLPSVSTGKMFISIYRIYMKMYVAHVQHLTDHLSEIGVTFNKDTRLHTHTHALTV